jgi:alpha/beta superfamily hydrolase
LRALVNRLPAEAHARLEIIKGAGHFFEGHLDELKRLITEWVESEMQNSGLRSQNSA